jgi:hypothetical protein
MDSEHPKTPSWDFLAPGLATKMKKLHLLEVSPFKLVVPTHQNAHVNDQPDSHNVTRPKTQHTCASCKNRNSVEQLVGLVPLLAEV